MMLKSLNFDNHESILDSVDSLENHYRYHLGSILRLSLLVKSF
jgi:hypothetical protein